MLPASTERRDEWGLQALRLRNASQWECSAFIRTPVAGAGTGGAAGPWGWEEEQQDTEGLLTQPLPSQRETDIHGKVKSKWLHKITSHSHGRGNLRVEQFSLIYRICTEERKYKGIILFELQETSKLGWCLLQAEIFLIRITCSGERIGKCDSIFNFP